MNKTIALVIAVVILMFIKSTISQGNNSLLKINIMVGCKNNTKQIILKGFKLFKVVLQHMSEVLEESQNRSQLMMGLNVQQR